MENKNDLKGDYVVTFIEEGDSINSGSLKIDFVSVKKHTYELKWTIKNKNKFIGKGFKIGKQLVVSYWMLP